MIYFWYLDIKIIMLQIFKLQVALEVTYWDLEKVSSWKSKIKMSVQLGLILQLLPVNSELSLSTV